MFNLDSIVNPDKLVEEIDAMLTKMSGVEKGSQDYKDMAEQLILLYKALELDTNVKTKVLDTYGKQNEIESRIAHQEYDATSKEQLAHREVAIREAELELKKKENESNLALRTVETTLKTKEIEDRRRVSPDTVAAIAANVVGILLIIGHERISVISTKALGFIPKVFK